MHIKISHSLMIFAQNTKVLNLWRNHITLQWLFLYSINHIATQNYCMSGALWSIMYIATSFDVKCLEL